MFIGIFDHYTPISDYIVSRNKKLKHVLNHHWHVSVMVPDERKQVAPILYPRSFKSTMASHESLEHPMNLVDGVHRILFIRQPFCRLGWVDSSLDI